MTRAEITLHPTVIQCILYESQHGEYKSITRKTIDIDLTTLPISYIVNAIVDLVVTAHDKRVDDIRIQCMMDTLKKERIDAISTAVYKATGLHIESY